MGKVYLLRLIKSIFGDILEFKTICINLGNYKRLISIGHGNDYVNDIISKVLDDYGEYQEI